MTPQKSYGITGVGPALRYDPVGKRFVFLEVSGDLATHAGGTVKTWELKVTPGGVVPPVPPTAGYTTLKAALAVTKPGGVIEIPPGNYDDSAVIDVPGVTIRGG